MMNRQGPAGRVALRGLGGIFAVGIGIGIGAPAAQAQTPYTTLNYGDNATFLTGIRGANIVGNYVIPDSTETGGLLYRSDTQVWSAMPVATPSGVNYPDAIGSSPYGPSFGSQSGILRVVGSYKTEASSPYDLSYLYDGAAAPGQGLTTLVYPSAPGETTLNTIAHSTFGNQVVGNYDTDLATGNAFIYDIPTGTFTTNNIPGAVSTTAYGIWGDKIAGGYAVGGGGPGFEHGYIYDQTTDTYETYDHPGAVITHFEGITGGGRAGEYNLVSDWVDINGNVHAGVLHIAADNTETWYEIEIAGAQIVSANSAYGDTIIGVYVDGDGVTNGYVLTLAGIYNPIRNDSPLAVSLDDATGITATPGDDVINSSAIVVSGARAVGISGETYGVITNDGTITVTGTDATGIVMNGQFGTLLNEGTITAAPGADAVRTGATAVGTVVVNDGIIDGRVVIAAGADARFENSGWMGISAPGAGTVHQISGTFAQTAAGTLALRIGADANDALQVTGAARLAGTLAAGFETVDLKRSYQVLTASGGATGTFETLDTFGLASFMDASLSYAPNAVTLNLTSAMAGVAGLTRNERATAAALDRAFNSPSGIPGALDALYGLSAGGLPLALDMLSGQSYASEQSVLIGDALYGRQAVLGRLRQGAYAGGAGPQAALAYGGPVYSYADGGTATPPTGIAALAAAEKAPGATKAPQGSGVTVWAQGFGGWGTLSGDGNAASVSENIGGVIGGGDVAVGNWRIGAAVGYSQSSADMDAVASSSDASTVLVGLYAGTASGPWNLRLGALYGFNQVDASRSVAFPGFFQPASAQYDGGTGQIFAEVGYGTALGPVAVEPFAGLAWVHLNTDGFTETAGAASLTGAASTVDVGYTSLGLRAATVIPLSGGATLSPHVSLAWQYAFGDLTPTSQLAFASMPGSGFTVAGVPLARNDALLEAGADLRLATGMRLGVSYVGQFGDGVDVNAVQANLTWSF